MWYLECKDIYTKGVLMFSINRNYCTVYETAVKPSVSDKILFVNLSSPKKKSDGGYDNSSWKSVKFVGEAFRKGMSLKKMDKIDIVNGIIECHYKENKMNVSVTVFDFELSQVISETESKFPNSTETGE